MIKVVYKQNNKKLQEKVLESKEEINKEIALVAKALQENNDENARVKEENKQLGLENFVLKNKNIGLKAEEEGLKEDIEKKRLELQAIESLVSDRNETLKILNNVVAKVSQSYSKEIAEKLIVLGSIKVDQIKYDELQLRYNLLQEKVIKLETVKVEKEKVVAEADVEQKKTKKLTEAQKDKLEQFKADQAGILKDLKFYAGRLNRYYESLQLPPPVDVSHL